MIATLAQDTLQSIIEAMRNVQPEYLLDTVRVARRVALLKRHFDALRPVQPDKDHVQTLKIALEALKGVSSLSSSTEEQKMAILNAWMEVDKWLSPFRLTTQLNLLPDHKNRTQSLAALVDAISSQIARPARQTTLQGLEVRIIRCSEGFENSERLSYRLEGGNYTFIDVIFVASTLNPPAKPGNFIHVYTQDVHGPFTQNLPEFPDYQKSDTLLGKFAQSSNPLDMYLVGDVGTFVIVLVDGIPHLVSGESKSTYTSQAEIARPRRTLYGTVDNLTWEALEKDGPLIPYQVYYLMPRPTKRPDRGPIPDSLDVTRKSTSTWTTAKTSQTMRSFTRTSLSTYSSARGSAELLHPFPNSDDDSSDDGGLQPKAITMHDLHSLNHLRIERSRVIFSKEEGSSLGIGAQGAVYRGTLHPIRISPVAAKLDGISTPILDVAVKVLRCSNYDTTSTRALLKEILTWSTLRHRNLLALIGFCFDGQASDALIVSSYQWRGSICKYIEKSATPLIERLEKISQTAAAVAYLHKQKVCHSDIKGENVFVGHDGNVLLGDFGLARTVERSEGHLTTGHVLGTTRWSSPELLVEGIRNFPGDVWSWGCLFVEIIKTPTLVPYHEIPDRSVMAKIVVEKSRRWPYLPSELEDPMDLRSVVEPCWQWEPKDRATMLDCSENVIRLFDPTGSSAEVFKEWAWKHARRILLEAKQEYLQYGHDGARCVSTCDEILAKIECEVDTKFLLGDNVSSSSASISETNDPAAREALAILRLLPMGVVD